MTVGESVLSDQERGSGDQEENSKGGGAGIAIFLIFLLILGSLAYLYYKYKIQPDEEEIDEVKEQLIESNEVLNIDADNRRNSLLGAKRHMPNIYQSNNKAISP